MTIRYVGHSCFLLTAKDGTRIVTDPYDGVGIAMPHLTADAVTVSHSHFDHANIHAIAAPLILDKAGSYQVGGVSIFAQDSFHDEVGGKKRGKNLIFKFEMDGISVCHLGDLGEDFSPARAKAIAPVDILLIPVGGTYTITAKEAKKYIEGIQPKIVVPMHYRAQGITLDIAPVEEFLKEFPEAVRVSGVAEFDKETLKNEIILMDRYDYGR